MKYVLKQYNIKESFSEYKSNLLSQTFFMQLTAPALFMVISYRVPPVQYGNYNECVRTRNRRLYRFPYLPNVYFLRCVHEKNTEMRF